MTCRPGDLREEVVRIRTALAAGYSVAHLARLYDCRWGDIRAILDGHVYIRNRNPDALRAASRGFPAM